jgi:WD40 repeat protein
VRAVDFIADSSRIVSGGEDATVRLWNYGASLTQEYSQTLNPIIYGLEASLASDFVGESVALVLTHSEC